MLHSVSWAIDSEPIRARGIIVNYTTLTCLYCANIQKKPCTLLSHHTKHTKHHDNVNSKWFYFPESKPLIDVQKLLGVVIIFLLVQQNHWFIGDHDPCQLYSTTIRVIFIIYTIGPQNKVIVILTLSLPEYLMEFCKVTLTFESADEILWCDHSNESSLPVLALGAICFSKFHKIKFGHLSKISFWVNLAVKGLMRVLQWMRKMIRYGVLLPYQRPQSGGAVLFGAQIYFPGLKENKNLRFLLIWSIGHIDRGWQAWT